MANSFKFKGVALATGSETALLTAGSDETIIIKSILVTNNTSNTPTLSLDVADNSASDAIKATISSSDSIHFGISYMSVT